MAVRQPSAGCARAGGGGCCAAFTPPVEIADELATRAAALALVLPPDVAAAGRTALWLLGLDVLGPCLEVTVPRGRHLRHRAGLAVFSAALPDQEVVLVGSLRAVSAARAFVDVARHESVVEAVALGDEVLRSGAATLEQLQSAVVRAKGLRGLRKAEAVVPHLEPRSESPMESRLRMRLVLGGVARAQAQWDVYTEDGHVGRGDLYLAGVVLEYDGRKERLEEKVFVAERRRQTALAETGLELRRFTARDVYVRPAAAICAEVVRAVAMAATRDRSRLRAGRDTLRPPRLRPLPTLAEIQAVAAGHAA